MDERTGTDAFAGCILGTAVGDALGLPFEFLGTRRAVHLFGERDRYHFFFGRGMVSDDTEHTCMTAQSLIAAGDDVRHFARDLAWRLRWWMAALPAGAGWATLRSIFKLWIGFSPEKSGVFSAGNGPAMRSAIIGVRWGHEPEILKNFIRASTILTHTDPKAYYGALAVALAAYQSAQGRSSPAKYMEQLRDMLAGENAGEFIELIEKAAQSADRMETTTCFAVSQGLEKGVSGYIFHTVPVVLHAWFVHGNDFRTALNAVIACGGDTDTTGAIIGGIAGAGAGKAGFPRTWLENFGDWPRNVAWLEKLAAQLASGKMQKPVRLPLVPLLARNLFFMMIVLFHGFRRLFPPY